MPAASFVVIVVRANPVPAGLCRRARHENALRATRKRSSLSSRTRKAFGFFSNEPLTIREVAGRRFHVRLVLTDAGQFPEGLLRLRERVEDFSRIDMRLASFRVARNARFRDRGAGATPKAGVGADAGDARRSRRLQPSRRQRTRQSRIARCPRLWFVVKNRQDASATASSWRVTLNSQ